MKSKKSQSNIIAIVLIILLCLVALIVVWQFIMPMSQGFKDEAIIRQELMEVKMSISDVSGDMSIPIGNRIDVMISSESDSSELYQVKSKSEITYNLRFIISNDTAFYLYNVPENIDSLLSEHTKTYNIETGGVTDINKIEMILVAHIAKGKDITESISTWTPDN